MRITGLYSLNNTSLNCEKLNLNNCVSITNERNPLNLPSAAHYVSFMGGSSLNLRQSIINLDGHAKDGKSNFPPDVRESALEVVSNGNPDDKTLIDIHKEKYSLLNDCYDLDDAKALFDEFKGVISDKDVDYKPDSFIARVKSGQIDNFNKDEDLAFQLLKLYWAEGFSLNDLKSYAGTELYYVLNKFHIPLMDRNYAHVLKFSDKEYNKRLTEQMSRKHLETLERRLQENSGEPVYIPRGPLSDAHKKHISESLLVYYSLNPQAALNRSKYQRKYFEDNPEQKEKLQKAMLYAWNNTQEGRSIKKHMIKFFNKEKVGLSVEVYSADGEGMTNLQRTAFKKFWEKNGWAREKFSTAVKLGWAEINKPVEIDSDLSQLDPYYISLVPGALYDDIKVWCDKKGINTQGLDFQKLKTQPPSRNEDILLAKILDKYIRNNSNKQDFIVSVVTGALVSVRNDILLNRVPKSISNNQDFLQLVATLINQTCYKDSDKDGYGTIMLDVVLGSSVIELLGKIRSACIVYKQKEFVDYIVNKMNKSYEILSGGFNLETQQEFIKFLSK